MKAKKIVLIALSILVFNGLLAQSTTDSTKQLSEALALIRLPEPTFKPSTPKPIDAKMLADLGFEQPNSSEPVFFTMNDGVKLSANKYAHQSKTIALVLHGVMGASYNFNRMAGLLRETLDAEVYALDLRGHGKSGGIPGDVAYIDQYAEDLKQVIEELKSKNPEHKIVIVGHSMGGGIALRHEMLKNHPDVEGYVLFAPHLGHNAPTLLNSQPKNVKLVEAEEPFLKLHIERLIGLTILNSMGIHDYDSLPVLFFNVPENMPLRTYTYRSNYSMAPQDYKKALEALDKPTLIVAGSEDEAFSSEHYAPVIQGYAHIQVVIVEGATHNGIRHEALAMQAVKTWAMQNKIIE